MICLGAASPPVPNLALEEPISATITGTSSIYYITLELVYTNIYIVHIYIYTSTCINNTINNVLKTLPPQNI